MSDKGISECSSVDIPQKNGVRVVPTATGERLSIRAETHARNTFRNTFSVPSENILVCAGSDIPEANCGVVAASGERLSIRAEIHASNTGGVANESSLDFAGVGIP